MTGEDRAGIDLAAARARATPDRMAVVDPVTDRRWTYAALDRKADAVARVLQDGPAGPIGLLARPRPAVAAVLFGAARINRPLVPLDPRESVPTVTEKVNRADVATVICGRLATERAVAVADGPCFCFDPVERTDLHRLQLGATGHTVDPVDRDSATTQLIVFTSGTTGTPKGVRLTVGNLRASATASAYRLGVSGRDRWLSPLPVCHMGGLAPILRSAAYGTTVVFQDGFDPEETARLLRAASISCVSLVPTALKRLLNRGWRPPASLRAVLVGGAPCGPQTIARCARRSVPVYPSYGATEAASQIATARPATAYAHLETVGQPLVRTELRILQDGRPVTDSDTVGEIAVAGPTITPGYLDEERTAEAFTDGGWFRTGDRGYRDGAGRLYVTGRSNERIITGGETVDPSAIAAIIEDYPAVATATVVGLPDPKWGQRVGALIVPSSPDATTVSALRDRLARDLPSHKRPRTIALTAELPRTAAGTVDRNAVRSRLAGPDGG